jgi:hypothetical protein
LDGQQEHRTETPTGAVTVATATPAAKLSRPVAATFTSALSPHNSNLAAAG